MAKKANSPYDGTLIQLKRTDLAVSDNTDTINDDGHLNFGEPLYFNNEKQLAIGGSDESVANSDLEVFKAVPRARVGTYYESADTGNQDSSGRVSLVSETGSNIYEKLNLLTTRDSSGIPYINKTSGNTTTKLTIYIPSYSSEPARWKKVSSTGTVTSDTATETDFPKAVYIEIPNMTSAVIPYVALAFSNAQQGSSSETKKLKKAFCNVTGVESVSDGIYIYAGYKNVTSDCYIDVYGG